MEASSTNHHEKGHQCGRGRAHVPMSLTLGAAAAAQALEPRTLRPRPALRPQEGDKQRQDGRYTWNHHTSLTQSSTQIHHTNMPRPRPSLCLVAPRQCLPSYSRTATSADVLLIARPSASTLRDAISQATAALLRPARVRRAIGVGSGAAPRGRMACARSFSFWKLSDRTTPRPASLTAASTRPAPCVSASPRC